ncbi:MAG: S46 family peptidase [Gemmatimonadales bacterium]
MTWTSVKAAPAGFVAVVVGVVMLLPLPAAAQIGGVDLDTIRAGRFDYGKMWTFEYAPQEYFSETYGFEADDAWFERARLAALRVPGCSASFVSPHGLLATNHHCVRGRIPAVAQAGETLLDSGYYAETLTQERRIPGYYADQLIAARDVSDEVFAAMDRADSPEARDAARREALQAIEEHLRQEFAGIGERLRVQFVPLYNGGRYSAYVFRRFTDVRLVAAVELQMGFFGGDPDNFTYPRYALDFAFLRVYDEDGTPYEPEHYFEWGTGVEPGDAVFLIGNPGSTRRLNTVAQLAYQRDISVFPIVNWLATRHAVLERWREAEPEAAEAAGIRNRMFGLSNSYKANAGRLEALNDPVIMARKADAERQLRDSIAAHPELHAEYGDLFERIARLQEEKREFGTVGGAFIGLTSSGYSSGFMRRIVASYAYHTEADPDSAEARRAELLAVRSHPDFVEHGFLTERLKDFVRFLGPDHEITRTALGGRTPEDAARWLLENSVYGSAERVAAGRFDPNDVGARLARVMMPLYQEYGAATGRIRQQESELAAQLGRVRFEVYGEAVAPDGSSSPRITDGVVRGYEYNGTLAPPYTTFYGVYDRHHGHEGAVDWQLPLRWRTPPEGLDLSTPLNFVSTCDSFGGNSGSPAVTIDLELVGLNFDRNIDGLSRDFIYLPARGRNVMVDVRAIMASLQTVYDADRLVEELSTRRFFESDRAAEAARN